MGFNLYATEVTLDFSKTRYAGAEVTLRPDVPWSKYLEFAGIKGLDDEVKWLQGNALVRWNLEDADGQPIPIDGDLTDVPVAFRRALVGAFITAVGEPNLAPLGAPSTSGGS